MDFDDNILKDLKVAWENTEPHLINLSILIENKSILEREGDESRREVAEKFLNLLKESLPRIKPELVKIQNGVGVFLDYSTLLKERFEILFYHFVVDKDDLGYWMEDEKRMYINVIDMNQYNNILKSKNIALLFDIYQSTIFHELIHRFDHMRYSGTHKPVDTDAYMNTYEEFNAYYQQYARSIDKIVSRMNGIDEFYKVYGTDASKMINNFWEDMPNEMKAEIKTSKNWTNKWNKRIYQLYYEKLKKFQNNHG